jgi:hypothetical protein
VQQIRWAYEMDGQEIDVLVCTSNSIMFVECKKPEIDDPIAQVCKLREKAVALWGNKQFRSEWRITDTTPRRFVLATWKPPAPVTKAELENQGVELLVLSQERLDIGSTARTRLRMALDARPEPRLRERLNEEETSDEGIREE